MRRRQGGGGIFNIDKTARIAIREAMGAAPGLIDHTINSLIDIPINKIRRALNMKPMTPRGGAVDTILGT